VAVPVLRLGRTPLKVICAVAAAIAVFATAAWVRLGPEPDPATGTRARAGFVIDRAGTYRGNWSSDDPDVPAVLVATTERVVIEQCAVSGPGDLIRLVPGADVIVLDCVASGLYPAASERARGVFVHADRPRRIVVEHNEVTGVCVAVLVRGYTGDHTATESIAVRYNRITGLDGRHGDGEGGVLGSAQPCHAVRVSGAADLRGASIRWNEVVQRPSSGAVEALVSVHRSGGTADSPLEIHDNHLHGAYSAAPATEPGRAGGVLVDGDGDTPESASAWVRVRGNQVVGTSGYGIAFRGGTDNVASGNVVLASNLLPNGEQVAGQGVGLVLEGYGGGTGRAGSRNAMHDNIVGWMNRQPSRACCGYRYDMHFPLTGAEGLYARNRPLADRAVTPEMEELEWDRWRTKLAAAGITIGPRTAANRVSLVHSWARIRPDGGGRVTVPYCAAVPCAFADRPDGVVVTARSPDRGGQLPVNLVAYRPSATGFAVRVLNQQGTPITGPVTIWYAAAVDGADPDGEAATVKATTDADGYATVSLRRARPAGTPTVVASGVSPTGGEGMPVSVLVTARSGTAFTVRVFDQHAQPAARVAVELSYLLAWSQWRQPSGPPDEGAHPRTVVAATATVGTDDQGYADVRFPKPLPADPSGVQVTGVAPAAGRRVAAGVIALAADRTRIRIRVIDETGRPVSVSTVTVTYHAMVDG
jgi:hypothetical protein